MSVYQEEIDRLFSKAERQLIKSASKPLPRNVHRLRTAIRRAEAVLMEVPPKLSRNQRKLVKLLAHLRRRAGKLRDIDVQIAALRGLKVSDEPGRKTQMIAALTNLRNTREKKLVKVLDRRSVQEVSKRLKRARREMNAEDIPDPLALASQIFERLAKANQTLSETSLHQYRINGKRARYVAELAGDRPEAQKLVGQLKQMQDVLGEWHDWLTLRNTVARLTDSGQNSPLLAALNNITRAKFREALQTVSTTKLALLPRTPSAKPSMSTALSAKSAPVPRATAAVA